MRIRAMAMIRRVLSICLLVGLTAGAVTAARGLGSRPDPWMVRLLGLPGAIESRAERGQVGDANETRAAKPPLVVQAEAFALYLNPVEPPKRTPPPARARAARVEVTPVAAVAMAPRFRVLGISYHRTKPEESKALVSEAGGSLRWVAPGAKLGPMVIKQINRGSILCEDAGGVHEVAVELDALPTLPAVPVQKPLELRPPENDRTMVVFAKEDLPQVPNEPPAAVETSAAEPNMEESPAPEVAEPEPPKEPAPASPTPGRRPRPARSIARRT